MRIYLLPKISKLQRGIYASGIVKLGGYVASAGLDATTTHIVGPDATRQETLDYLRRSVKGHEHVTPATKILPDRWLQQSIRQKKFLPEQLYELLDPPPSPNEPKASATKRKRRSSGSSSDSDTSDSDNEDARQAKGGHARSEISGKLPAEAFRARFIQQNGEIADKTKVPLSKAHYTHTEPCRRSTREHGNRNGELSSLFTQLANFYKINGGGIDSQRRYIAFRRVAGSLRACPFRITSSEQARLLPQISDKSELIIDEYFRTGEIKRLETFKQSKELQIIKELTEIHGVGPSVARLWLNQGITSIRDLVERQDELKLTRLQKIALECHSDLKQPFLRMEIEECAKLFESIFQGIDREIKFEVCGSYRRGKEMSHDMDIILTHPNYKNEEETLMNRILSEFRARQILIHELSRKDNEFADPKAKKQKLKMDGSVAEGKGLTHTHLQRHDGLLGVFRPFPLSPLRRIDITYVPYEQYYCAILAWTGSDFFERSIRHVADQSNWHLSHHSLSDQDRNFVDIQKEEDIFTALNLEYLTPEERCV